MNPKNKGRPLLMICFTFLGFACYLFFYLFPSLRSMNEIRREAADRTVLVKRFLQDSGSFIPLGKAERIREMKLRKELKNGYYPWAAPANQERLEEFLALFFQNGMGRRGIRDCCWRFQGDLSQKEMPVLVVQMDFSATIREAIAFCRYLLSFPYRLLISRLQVELAMEREIWHLELKVSGFSGIGEPSVSDSPQLDMNAPVLSRPLQDDSLSTETTENIRDNCPWEKLRDEFKKKNRE